MQGWLDQYQEESMMPCIYATLEDGSNLTVTELLECMDHELDDVRYDDSLLI